MRGIRCRPRPSRRRRRGRGVPVGATVLIAMGGPTWGSRAVVASRPGCLSGLISGSVLIRVRVRTSGRRRLRANGPGCSRGRRCPVRRPRGARVSSLPRGGRLPSRRSLVGPGRSSPIAGGLKAFRRSTRGLKAFRRSTRGPVRSRLSRGGQGREGRRRIRRGRVRRSRRIRVMVRPEALRLIRRDRRRLRRSRGGWLIRAGSRLSGRSVGAHPSRIRG